MFRIALSRFNNYIIFVVHQFARMFSYILSYFVDCVDRRAAKASCTLTRKAMCVVAVTTSLERAEMLSVVAASSILASTIMNAVATGNTLILNTSTLLTDSYFDMYLLTLYHGIEHCIVAPMLHHAIVFVFLYIYIYIVL